MSSQVGRGQQARRMTILCQLGVLLEFAKISK